MLWMILRILMRYVLCLAITKLTLIQTNILHFFIQLSIKGLVQGPSSGRLVNLGLEPSNQ